MGTKIDLGVPQPAPWPVGTKVRYLGTHVSGFLDDGGNTVWSNAPGVIYTVVGVHPPGGIDHFRDEETGELRVVVYHGWSTLQSERDPDARALRGIDIEQTEDYEVLVQAREEPQVR